MGRCREHPARRQLITGAISDKVGRKRPIVLGMMLQSGAIWMMAEVGEFPLQATAAVLLGVGTAMVYPTLIAAITDVAHPQLRASAVGVYRLWRDLGYAAGALLSGVMAHLYGVFPAVLAVAVVTLISGAVVFFVFKE